MASPALRRERVWRGFIPQPAGRCPPELSKTVNHQPGLLSTLVVRRVDAWGNAAISAGIALVVHDIVTPQTIGLLACIALLYWLGYFINDYFDAPFDACDEHKARSNFFVVHTVPPNLFAIVVAAVSLGLLAAFATFGVLGVAVLALGNVAMWGYSAPPMRLKSRPGLDLIVHALFVLTFPYCVVLLLAEVTLGRLDWLLLGIIFLASLAGQLRQQIRDFDVDSRTDVNFTTTVGLRTSVLLLRGTTTVTVIIASLAIAGGMAYDGLFDVDLYAVAVLLILALLCLPVLVDRATAQSGRPESGQQGLPVAMVALTYYGVVLVHSLLR